MFSARCFNGFTNISACVSVTRIKIPHQVLKVEFQLREIFCVYCKMTSEEQEQQIGTTEEMVLALKAEMGSLKADEESLRGQILSLNEQFKLLVKSVAEKFPEIMDEKFPQKIAAKRQLLTTPNKDRASAANEPSGITNTPTKGSRIPTYSRLNFSGSRVSPHRIPSLDSQRFPRGFMRRNSEETEAMMREQFQRNVNSGSGINARKIRDSLPNSPTWETEPYSRHLENSEEDEKRSLTQKRTDSKNIDVVNLGLF